MKILSFWSKIGTLFTGLMGQMGQTIVNAQLESTPKVMKSEFPICFSNQ